ncbi:MAG: hypothetical protein QOE68_3027, partial [Thermoanaerobaculia bacterium]|nr:hypothetical protein [Thermoanaerobaculia bacterium]
PVGKLITVEEFNALRYPRSVTDPKQRPSVIAKNTRLGPAETTIYKFENVQVTTFSGCGRTYVRFIRVGTTSIGVNADIPGPVCRAKSQYKDAFAKLETDYPALSVWKGNPNVTNICGSAGDATPPLRIFGIGFWDDDNGEFPPELVLDPIISIEAMGDTGTGDGNPGTGGTPGAGGTPTPTGLTVVLPDAVRAAPVVMGNSGSTTVLFSTFASSTSTSDVTVSAVSDADDLLVSVNHPVIAAPGIGDEILTIHTTPTTTAGDHVITITANDGTTTSSASVYVTVLCDPPFILGLDQPKGSTVGLGRPAQLSVKASGSGPFSYQWFTGASGLSNFPLPGGTAANFTTSALNDTTSYWVRITNPCGSVNSQTATVNVSASAKPTSRR